MNRNDSLKPVTRRALRIDYVSAGICEDRASAEDSASGCGLTSQLEVLAVSRAAGPTITVSAYTAGKLYVAWTPVNNAFVYVVYRSTSVDGLFTIVREGTQELFYVDTPPESGTFYYKVTGIEPNFGETERSNIESGTV